MNNKPPFSKVMFKGTFIYNPVLTQAIGVCTIVAIASTLKIALASSLILSILLVFCEVISSYLLTKIARWIRIALYMIISVLILIPVTMLLDNVQSDLVAGMGIFLPLLSANSLIVIRCENFAVKNSVKLAFYDAVAGSAGYTAVSLIVGLVREVLAYNTVFGKAVPFPIKIQGFALPFCGLLCVGFLSAVQKWIIQKKFRGQPTNIFNLSSSMETPVLRDEGLGGVPKGLSFIRDKEILEAEAGTDEEDILVLKKSKGNREEEKR